MEVSLDVRMTAPLRAEAAAACWSMEQTVDAIVERFGMSRLKAHRLARGWTRPRAVEEILATYDTDGLARTGLTEGRLCNWEHGKRRPGEDYQDRLCRVYQTRSDLLGFGHDYSAEAEQEPEPAAALAADYAGHDGPAQDQEAGTHRRQLFHAAGAAGAGLALEQSGLASMRLSQMVEETNVGPVTLEHLERQVAGILANIWHTPCDRMLCRTTALRDDVTVLLDGRQTLAQRAALFRIAGQLSRLLAWTADDLGNYPVACAHLLTAEQLAREVGDHTLLAAVRVGQSTVALWDGDVDNALSYAQDGQRYATSGAQQAQLAARCEARALARMGDHSGVYEALGRAERALPSYQSGDDPDSAWTLFRAGDLELYAAISLLWLGQPRDTEPHARQAIAYYETAPRPFQSPGDHAQSQINLALCLVHQGHPEEAVRLATDALALTLGDVECNLQQAGDLLAALTLRHHDLPATRDFADHLRTLRGGPSA